MFKKLLWSIIFLSFLGLGVTGQALATEVSPKAPITAHGGTIARQSDMAVTIPAFDKLVMPVTVRRENNNLENAEALLDRDNASEPLFGKGNWNYVYFEFFSGIIPAAIKLYLPEKTENVYSLEYLTTNGVWANFLESTI